MSTKSASALWHGSLKDGKGDIKLESGAFAGQYSFNTRFENAPGTNPEELIGAALAACYSMAMSAELGKNNYQPESVETNAIVHLNKSETGFAINLIELNTHAKCNGLNQGEFESFCETVRKNCPVAKALAGTQIVVHGKLN